ncbi:MAG: hypothetical protein ACKOBB_13155, partial [Acidimicrobiaceae bacterium]
EDLSIDQPRKLSALFFSAEFMDRGLPTKSCAHGPAIGGCASGTTEVIAESPSVQREDVSALFNNKDLEFSGFNFSIKESGITKTNEQFELVAIYANSREIQIAKLGRDQKNLTDISTVQINQTSEASFDAAWFSLDTDSLRTLNAVPQTKPSTAFKFALNLFDLLIFALTGLGMLVAIGFAVARPRIRVANFVLFAISLLAVSRIIESTSFDWWGYRHAAIPIAVAISLAIVHWRAKSINMYVVLFGAFIAVTAPIISFIREFNGLESADWWGFQIFSWSRQRLARLPGIRQNYFQYCFASRR